MFSSAIEDVSWRYITECLVIAAEVVVVDEASDGPFRLAGKFVGDLVNLPLNRPLVALRVTVRLDMAIYHLGFHPISRWGGGRFSSAAFLKSAVAALRQAQHSTGKPVLLALNPAPDLDGMKDFLAAQEAFVAAGFPVFHSLRPAARAMARVAAWNRA